MRGLRSSSLLSLPVAILALGWAAGCSDNGGSELLLPQHGAQAVPVGEYSIVWADVEIAGGAGQITVPGETDMVLAPDQVKDLAHSLFNITAVGRHGWEVTPVSDGNGVVGLTVDPHPHGIAKALVSYETATGQAVGSLLPVTFTAPSAALNAAMRAFIVRAMNVEQVQDVSVTKFEASSLDYAFHWTPDALELEPADIGYPSLAVRGVRIEGTFYIGETQGSFSVTIDTLAADARGTQVSGCPECAAPVTPGRRPPIGVLP